MWYIYLENNIVCESIPEFHSDFPGIPVEERYSADFLHQCIQWEEQVPQGWEYDEETTTFTPPNISPSLPADIDGAKVQKLEEIGIVCEETISAGATVNMSAGEENFSFDLASRTLILGLYNDLMLCIQGQGQYESKAGIIFKDGDYQVPYHYDNGLCRYFGTSDWTLVVQELSQLTLYQTTYANVAAVYISSLTDVDAINSFRYGDTLPEPWNGHYLYIATSGEQGQLMI